MTADPIRDALREAGEAARDSFACKPCGEPCTLPPCWCADAAAAAAVAAFLRALPDESGMNIAAPDARDDWFGCDELAAAVERAAKEGA